MFKYILYKIILGHLDDLSYTVRHWYFISHLTIKHANTVLPQIVALRTRSGLTDGWTFFTTCADARFFFQQSYSIITRSCPLCTYLGGWHRYCSRRWSWFRSSTSRECGSKHDPWYVFYRRKANFRDRPHSASRHETCWSCQEIIESDFSSEPEISVAAWIHCNHHHLATCGISSCNLLQEKVSESTLITISTVRLTLGHCNFCWSNDQQCGSSQDVPTFHSVLCMCKLVTCKLFRNIVSVVYYSFSRQKRYDNRIRTSLCMALMVSYNNIHSWTHVMDGNGNAFTSKILILSEILYILFFWFLSFESVTSFVSRP